MTTFQVIFFVVHFLSLAFAWLVVVSSYNFMKNFKADDDGLLFGFNAIYYLSFLYFLMVIMVAFLGQVALSILS